MSFAVLYVCPRLNNFAVEYCTGGTSGLRLCFVVSRERRQVEAVVGE